MFGAKDYSYTIWWNLLLMTVGAALFAVGVKGVVVHHGFITGGIMGLSLLGSYGLGGDPSLWFLACNIPLFVLGWVFVSRRFCLYSVYGMLAIAIFVRFFEFNLGVQNQLYAAVAAGVICGAGAGVTLRSLGSSGGLDVIIVTLNQKFGIGPGKTSFVYSCSLFLLALVRLKPDLVIASIIQVFIMAAVLEYVLSMFNQRKMVLIISEKSDIIAKDILHVLQRGATFLSGKGAYSGKDKNVLMTIINNIQLKRLEELVFTHDPEAMFIVENTFTVMGQGFSLRKRY